MAKTYTKEELAVRYERSETGAFKVCDTIGVPHPYTVGPKHIEHASKFCSGMLGERTLKTIKCAHPRCTLTYDQHETALLVECRAPLKDEAGITNPELHAYLFRCKSLCEEDGYAGFAFVNKQEKTK